MIKSVPSPACNNFINFRRPLYMACINTSCSRLLATKVSATSSNVFQWANSEGNDTSTSASTLSLTPNFILPVEKRPNLAEVCKYNVPLIDLGMDDTDRLVEDIAIACEKYGLFLIVNHGVPQELCESMLSSVIDLFHLPAKVKALLVSDDAAKDVRISNHFRKVEEQGDQKAKRFSMWSEVFKHPWHPTDDRFADLLPSDPPNYRYEIY